MQIFKSVKAERNEKSYHFHVSDPDAELGRIVLEAHGPVGDGRANEAEQQVQRHL